MANTEIMLLGGAPGSGKSSVASRVVELDNPRGVRHLSIGELKRSILAGETPSAYRELLQQSEHPDRKTGAAPSEAMTGIMEEFILAQPNGLTIIDGFPRYQDRIKPFKESMAKIGASVLALCVVTVDEETSIARLKKRAVREGQKIKDPKERLADHQENIVPTLVTLAAELPYYELDGSEPVDNNAARLVGIYAEVSKLGIKLST